MITVGLDKALEAKLSRYVPLAEFQKLAGRLDGIEEENRRLREGVDEFKKEIYSVKDLAKSMCMQPGTVRKNYIKTGKVAATMGTNNEYGIQREEYMRVMDIVNTRGTNWLKGD